MGIFVGTGALEADAWDEQASPTNKTGTCVPLSLGVFCVHLETARFEIEKRKCVVLKHSLSHLLVT